MQLKQSRGEGRRRGMRGLSLVELMVGITVGLIVVAAATVLLSGQLAENRRLIAEAQVQQDIRATTDIITRELRRSGAIGTDPEALQGFWSMGSAADAAHNGVAATLTPAAGEDDIEVSFNYFPGGAGTDGPFGFRFNEDAGVIQTWLRAGGWQDLTDRNTVEVRQFTVERLDDASLLIPCPKACSDGTTDCWPRILVRTLEVTITARARLYPEVERTFRSRARLRNDYLQYFNVTPPARVCPT